MMVDTLCNKVFSSITDKSALSYFPFSLYELSSVDKIDLKIVAFIDFAGGYARHGRDVVEYLDNSGLFNIKLQKLKSVIDIDPFIYDYFKHLIEIKIDENKCIELVIGAPGHMQRLKNSKLRYKIGYTMAETLHVPQKFLDMCCHCDELFLPTELDMKRFNSIRNFTKLTKLPLWVDIERYNWQIKKANLVNVPKNNFVFMFVGSWNKRKGIHEIIEAFINEFSSKEPVSLIIFSKYTTSPFNDVKRKRDKNDKEKWNILWEYENLLETTKLKYKNDKPHICVLDVAINENIMPNIMKNAIVCIGTSKGESTWLPGLEFGAMGITSIQTDWGGHKDYLNEDNSFLIPIAGFDKCDEELYFGVSDYYYESEMARIEVIEIQKKMRYAFENPYHVQRKGTALRKLIQREYKKKDRLEAVKNRLIEINETSIEK